MLTKNRSSLATVYWAWGLIGLFKIIFATWIPVGGDEAYYWVWSLYPDIGYYDHPPFVAWIFLFAPKVAGWETLIRIPGVLISHASLLFWIALLKDHVTPKRILFFLALISACPMTGLGSIIMTPDIPLLFFWSAAVWITPTVVLKRSLKNYILLGTFLGLAFLSKYQAVLFLPPLFIWLTLGKKWGQVSPLGVLVAIVSGLLACSPVLLWNYWNDFISFQFQLGHGLGAEKWDPEWTFTYLLAALLMGFPTVYWKAWFQKNEHLHFLFWFAAFPLLFFFLTSFKGKVEANWPITAYPALFALAAANINQWKTLIPPLAFWNAVILLLLVHFYRPWIPNFPDQPPQIRELWQNKVFLDEIDDSAPLFAHTYQAASYLYLYSGRPVFKLRGTGRVDFYDFLEGSLPTTDRFRVAAQSEFQLAARWKELGYQETSRKDLGHGMWLIEVAKP